MQRSLSTAVGGVLCIAILRSFVETFNLDTTQPIFFSGPTRSYFGYSVDVMPFRGRPYVIVGSPKANMSWMRDIPEPGGVFQCDASKKCSPITIDTGIIQRILDPLNEAFKDRKDGQWLGATVSVLRNKDPLIAACAPRWKNAFYSGSLLMSGMCYVKTMTESGDSPATMLRPLLDVSKISFSTGGYGFGQAGMSATFYQRRGRAGLMMGATGLDEGTGGVASKRGRKYHVQRKIVESKGSYLGYSLQIGQLDIDRSSILVGGPGYHKLGLVKVLRDDQRWEGAQVGAYFGSSICTIDTNGDTLAEVVIGAPLFSSKAAVDSGIAYVYMNSEFDRVSKEPVVKLTGSGAARARFGTSLSNVGDLNMDRYNDLAVGAPFEDDWSGCIYIYNGGPKGLTNKFSQRICGGNLQSDLRGFGWSISPSIDMDNNMYQDFAVGAFISDDTVLLRARPIIDMKPKFTVNPKVINQMVAPGLCPALKTNAYCVTVKLCLTFDVLGDANSRLTADVNFTLASDTRKRSGEAGRARFIENEKAGRAKLLKTIRVPSTKVTCDESVVVIELTSDLLTPITFEAEYNLIPASIATSNQISPILNQFSERKLVAEAAFRLSCGEDNECLTDLSLELLPVTGLPHGGFFISGQDNPARVPVIIRNRGESAYETIFTTDLANAVQYTGNKWGTSKSVVRCSKVSLQRIHCIMGNPVKANTTLKGELIISGRNIHPRTKQLEFSANVTTTSRDTDSRNNRRILTSFVRLKADLAVRGESAPEQMLYTPAKIAEEKDGFRWRDLNFTHEITIHNKGPSLLPKAKVSIFIPVKHKELFACYYDNQVKFTFDDDTPGSKQSCTVYNKLIEPGNVNITTPATTMSPTWATTPGMSRDSTSKGPNIGESIGEEVVNRRKRAASGRRTNAHIADCSVYSCMQIMCSLEHIPSGATARFKISLGLYERQVATFTEEGGVIHYQSSVYIQPEDKEEYAPLLDRTPLSAKVTSTLNPVPTPAGSVASWIIIVSVIAGLILLIILGIILWKCGFFKRKKHMQVQQMKREGTVRKSTYVGDTDLDMQPEVIEPDEVKPRPPSHYTVSPSEEPAPELQNKEPLPEPTSNPRPVSLALPEHTDIGDSMESLPPPPSDV